MQSEPLTWNENAYLPSFTTPSATSAEKGAYQHVKQITGFADLLSSRRKIHDNTTYGLFQY